MAERIYLTIAEVLKIHRMQIEEYGGIDGIRDNGLLEAAVFRPQIGYYNTVAEEAAALMESLANNHPFIDGNKRVAFACTNVFLLMNGLDLAVDPLAAYDFMMELFEQKRFRYPELLQWITKNLIELST